MLSRINVLQVGQFTDPIQSQDGRWHLFKLNGRREQAQEMTFEQVKDQIAQSITDQRKQVVLSALLREAIASATVHNNLATQIVTHPDNFGALRPSPLTQNPAPSTPTTNTAPATNTATPEAQPGGPARALRKRRSPSPRRRSPKRRSRRRRTAGAGHGRSDRPGPLPFPETTMLFRFDTVTKAYGAHDVLHDVSFQVNPGDHVGLVGRNGAGKTTIFKLLLAVEDPDSGRVDRARNLRIGLLEQQVGIERSGTVREATLEVFAELHAMETDMRRLEHEMAAAEGDALDEILHTYSDLQHRFEEGGGFSMHARAESVLLGLGFSREDLNLNAATLSGGQRARLALARLLLEEPDILLLDEPTNHLDVQAVEWLEESSRRVQVRVRHHLARSLSAGSHRKADRRDRERARRRLHRKLLSAHRSARRTPFARRKAISRAAGARRANRRLHPKEPRRAEDEAGKVAAQHARAHGAPGAAGHRRALDEVRLRRGDAGLVARCSSRTSSRWGSRM